MRELANAGAPCPTKTIRRGRTARSLPGKLISPTPPWKSPTVARPKRRKEWSHCFDYALDGNDASPIIFSPWNSMAVPPWAISRTLIDGRWSTIRKILLTKHRTLFIFLWSGQIPFTLTKNQHLNLLIWPAKKTSSGNISVEAPLVRVNLLGKSKQLLHLIDIQVHRVHPITYVENLLDLVNPSQISSFWLTISTVGF